MVEPRTPSSRVAADSTHSEIRAGGPFDFAQGKLRPPLHEYRAAQSKVYSSYQKTAPLVMVGSANVISSPRLTP